MNYLQTYSKEISDKLQNIDGFVADLIIMNTPTFLNTVKRRWIIGRSVDGGIIGQYQNSDYKAYKVALNPSAGGNVDLHLTGDLSDNLTMRKAGKSLFEIYSTDWKFEKIGRKYGFDEFGLSEEEKDLLFSEIYEVALEYILKQLWQ